MKRFLCLVMCAVMMFSVCACGDVKPAETASESEEAAGTDETAAESGSKESMKAFMARFDDTPTVGDKLIYQDANITVTAHGINYAVAAGPELHLTVENNFDKDITLQAPYAVVNGYMITPELNIGVPAGKSANGNLTLSYFSLAIADITCIQNIELSLRAVETKSYEPLFKSELLSVPTSAFGSSEIMCDDSGQTVYDEGDIKIVLKGVNTDRSYSDGAEMTVYMYNGTDRGIAVQTGDTKVNGYDMTSVMNRTILPGCRAVDVVTFYTLDLDEYGIETIDSIEVSFDIKDADSWESIGSTGMVSVAVASPEAARAPTTA